MIFIRTYFSLLLLSFFQMAAAQTDTTEKKLTIWDEIVIGFKTLPDEVKSLGDGYREGITGNVTSEAKQIDSAMAPESKELLTFYRPGYIVLTTGDTIKGRVKIIDYGVYNYFEYTKQWDIQFRDEKGKKEKYRPGTIRAWNYEDDNGIAYTYVSVKNDVGVAAPWFRNSSQIFLPQTIEGPVELLRYNLFWFNEYYFNPQTGLGSSENLCLKRGDEKLFKIKYGHEYNHYKRFKKSLSAYFSDYPELSNKILSGEYGPMHLRVIIDEYNKWKTTAK